jgi:predicted dehydrogenase
MSKINIAILGGSNRSAVGRAHMAALRISNQFSITNGLFSRNPRTNTSSREEYGIQSEDILETFEQFVNYCVLHECTALVLTPTDIHSEQVTQLIKSGVSVICEKALSVSYAGLEDIKESLIQNQGFLRVIYNYTSYPAIALITEMCKKERIGKVFKVNALMPQESYVKLNPDGKPAMPQNWRLKDYEVATIGLDLGVHLHSLVSKILERKFVSLNAKESNYGNFNKLIDNVTAIAEYEDDIEVNYWYSKSAMGQRNGLKIEIYGKSGSLVWEQIHPEEIIYTNMFGKRELIDRGSPDTDTLNRYEYSFFKAGHPSGFIEALANYYLGIAHDLENYKKSDFKSRTYGIEESLESFLFLKAIKSSSIEKRWVTYNEVSHNRS